MNHADRYEEVVDWNSLGYRSPQHFLLEMSDKYAVELDVIFDTVLHMSETEIYQKLPDLCEDYVAKHYLQ